MSLPGSLVVDPRMLGMVRSVHECAMTDRCEVRRPQGEPVTSDDGLTVTFTPELLRYQGPCRVRPYADGAREREAAERVVTLRTYHVFLPWDAGPVEHDDVVTVVSSQDPDIDGRALRVVDVQVGSLQGERPLLCEEVAD